MKNIVIEKRASQEIAETLIEIGLITARYRADIDAYKETNQNLQSQLDQANNDKNVASLRISSLSKEVDKQVCEVAAIACL